MDIGVYLLFPIPHIFAIWKHVNTSRFWPSVFEICSSEFLKISPSKKEEQTMIQQSLLRSKGIELIC